jgi:hypothetical protein
MKWMPNGTIDQEMRDMVWRAFCSDHHGGMGQTAHAIMRIVDNGTKWGAGIALVIQRALYRDPDHPTLDEFLKRT